MKYQLIILFLIATFLLKGQAVQLQSDSLIQQGLVYFHYTTKEPQSIHVLEVDLTVVRLELGLAMDQVVGQETVRSLVDRKSALAGVNGGFSYSNSPWNIHHGDPKDFLVKDGQLLSEPFSSRSSFGWRVTETGEQEPSIAQFSWQGWLLGAEDSLGFHGVNRKLEAGEIVLYNSWWNNTTLSPAGTFECILDAAGNLLETNRKGSNVIPPGGWVITFANDSLSSLLPKGQRFKIRHRLYDLLSNQEYDFKNTSFHTAGPLLIQEGKYLAHQESESIPQAFVDTRHPRTGVGFSKDRKKLWLVVVDGRQETLSIGMSLPELASFMEDLGAWSAYNLDGGGSSTMVIGGKVMNSPSDGEERRRCDALLLLGQ